MAENIFDLAEENCVQFKIIEYKSNPLGVFLRKGVLKICSKFTGEQPRRNVISIKLQRNFNEITLRYGCSPVKFATYFQNTFS